MSAVVRVKRRIDEDPLSALVLNCKRRRTEDDDEEVRGNLFESSDEVSTILKFAGTVETQDESISSQITRLSKDDAKELVQKTRKPNISERSRQEMRHSIQENRFKVVNCYRAVKDDEETPQEITVVDIEKQTNDIANSNSTTGGDAAPQTVESQPPEGGGQYVYDLYLPESGQQQPSELNYIDTYLSVRPFDNLVYEETFNNDLDDDDDSEDSNQENYFRNDYPDTEEESSVDEADMRRAVARMGIDDDGDLSSDCEYYEYADDYVHTVDDDDDNSEVDYLSSLRNRGHSKKNRDYDEHDSELDESD